jgi:hypothetical protein
MSVQTGSEEAVSTNLVNESIGASGKRPVGFFEWARAVREAPPDVLPRHVKATLLMLGTYADANGRGAFPSAATLGGKLGKSERSVGTDLRRADAAGFVARIRRNRQKTYRCRLTIPTGSGLPLGGGPSGSGLPLATGSGLPDTYTEDLHRENAP